MLLLEVGMGGRRDATNVIDKPLLTIITPIGLDHQAFLGETLAEIANAKAGILKRGATCVVARQEREALDVIEAEAERVGAPLVVHGRDFDAYAQNGRLVYQDEDGLLDLPLPALAGGHQVDNAGTAIAAALRLGELAPDPDRIAEGLRSVSLARPFPAASRIALAIGITRG